MTGEKTLELYPGKPSAGPQSLLEVCRNTDAVHALQFLGYAILISSGVLHFLRR